MWPWSAGGEGRGSCEFAGGAGPALSAISSAQPCLGQVLPEGVHLSRSSGLGAACFILNHTHESERDTTEYCEAPNNLLKACIETQILCIQEGIHFFPSEGLNF